MFHHCSIAGKLFSQGNLPIITAHFTIISFFFFPFGFYLTMLNDVVYFPFKSQFKCGVFYQTTVKIGQEKKRKKSSRNRERERERRLQFYYTRICQSKSLAIYF